MGVPATVSTLETAGGTPVLEETTIVIDSDVWIDESRAI